MTSEDTLSLASIALGEHQAKLALPVLQASPSYSQAAWVQRVSSRSLAAPNFLEN